MAKLIDNLDQLLPSFEEWYARDHGPNEDHYSKTITQSNLSQLSNNKFISFFVNFRRDGGLIQSGGKRGIVKFEEMISNKIKDFRNHILQPFQRNFDITAWIKNIGNFPQWGFGIATIYLVRVNKNSFAVLNNKSIAALDLLGFSNVSYANLNTYLYVLDVQKSLMNMYPQINNYYKADALCHYIVGEKEGSELCEKILAESRYKSFFIDNIEEERSQRQIESDSNLADNRALVARINEIEDSNTDTVTYSGKQFKRNIYKIELIKKLRKYTCQFCGKTIVKKDKTLYVEACHIKPKSEGGDESLHNILILCPNCHKEFDLGYRKSILHTQRQYGVEVNGKSYTINFES